MKKLIWNTDVKVELPGCITSDAKDYGSIVRFSQAVNYWDGGKSVPEFHNCVIFKNTTPNLDLSLLRKGAHLIVCGVRRINPRTTGSNPYEVVVSEIRANFQKEVEVQGEVRSSSPAPAQTHVVDLNEGDDLPVDF